MNWNYVILVFLILLVISGCSKDPAKTTCTDLGGEDRSAMEECPPWMEGVRAKDSCKSCQCCVPISE